MPTLRPRQSSFARGEFAPAFNGRSDVEGYGHALLVARNWIPLPSGAITNRPGLERLGRQGGTWGEARLFAATFGGDPYQLEFGQQYIRFWKAGALVLSGGAPVEVVTPFHYSYLAEMDHQQTGNTVVLTSRAYGPYELRWGGPAKPTTWTLAATDFQPLSTQVAGLAFDGTPDETGSAERPAKEWEWVVTWTDANGRESVASAGLKTTSGKVSLYSDRPVNLTWTLIAAAKRYDVYRTRNGIFGWVGGSTSNRFRDDGQEPDLTSAPPRVTDLFDGRRYQSGSHTSYPVVTAQHDQRRLFGGMDGAESSIVLSGLGDFYRLEDFAEVHASDAPFVIELPVNENEQLRHLVSKKVLFALTDRQIWTIASPGAVTKESVEVRGQGGAGASTARPAVLDGDLVFVEEGGGAVRVVRYSQEAEAFDADDLGLFAHHLFETRKVVELAVARRPFPILWARCDDGELLSCTYVRKQRVLAWARHDTPGFIESISLSREGAEDRLYATVRRGAGTAAQRSIERMASRTVLDAKLGVFLDAAVTVVNGSPSATVSVPHLDGLVVDVLADGFVQRGLEVKNNVVTLARPATRVTVGLPYTQELEQLDLAEARDAQKTVKRLIVEVERTRGLMAGDDRARLVPVERRRAASPSAEPALETGRFEFVCKAAPTQHGRAVVVQHEPLPATVLSITREVDVGG